MEIKILQWNIRCKEKPENIIRVLNEVDADIICLQEVTEENDALPGVNVLDRLLEAFPHACKFFVAQNWKENGKLTMNMGNAILSKFGFAGENAFFIQDSGGDKPAFDDEGRVYGEVDILVGEHATLTVATTHMSYTDAFAGSPKRDEENRQLLKAITMKPRRNYVFCGDLNATPDSDFIQSFEQKTGLIPALFFADKTWTTKPFTYRGFKAEKLDWRLDYVFTSTDVDVISAQVIETDASDHLPILTTIKL